MQQATAPVCPAPGELGYTLPAHYYTSQDIFAHERRPSSRAAGSA